VRVPYGEPASSQGRQPGPTTGLPLAGHHPAILEGGQPTGLSLARTPKLLPLPWTERRHLLGCPLNTDAIKRAKIPLAAP
jgi:hypothetical protein